MKINCKLYVLRVSNFRYYLFQDEEEEIKLEINVLKRVSIPVP